MTPEAFVALLSFAFVMAFTPGPNNIMLTASAANFGFRRSIPHMLGVTLGFVALLAAAGAGLGALMAALPSAQTALKLLGAAYMLWLAFKIATAGGGGKGATGARPLTFLQAATFQWVNPKGVVAALGAVALFVRPERASADVLVLLIVFGIVTFGAVVAWSGFGAAIAPLIEQPIRLRIFNACMALLLVASIVPMVL